MNRRSFLTACLATFTAPAIVTASNLMPLSVPRLVIWGDGIHDDYEAVQTWIYRAKTPHVSFKNISATANSIGGGKLLLSRGLDVPDGRRVHLHDLEIIIPNDFPKEPILNAQGSQCSLDRIYIHNQPAYRMHHG